MLQGLKIEPDNYKALFNVGVINKKLGNIEQSRKYYELSIRQKPDFPYAYFNLAITYAEEGNFEVAIKIITEGIRRNSDVAVLYYNRGCYYARMGKKEKALRDIIKATQLDQSIIPYMVKDKELDLIRDMKAYQLFFGY